MPASSRKRQRHHPFADAAPQIHEKCQTFDKDLDSASGWLPHDLIKHCLTYLNHNELVSYRLVNHAWLAAVADCVECLLSDSEKGQWLACRKEFAKGKWIVTEGKQSMLVLCSLSYMTEAFRERITEIEFESHHALRLAVRHLHGCKSLRSLTAVLVAIGNDETVIIQGVELIPQLQEVYIAPHYSVAPCKVDARWLVRCRSLKKLSLKYCCFTETELQGIEKIPTLEWLDLYASYFSQVGFLARCRALKVLSLQACSNLKDANIAGLERIPTLEELNLSQVNLTDVTVLGKCKALKKLSLLNCYITETGIQGLVTMPALEWLNLDFSRFSHKVGGEVNCLAHCRALKVLSLYGCDLKDADIVGLERIPTLEDLCLRQTNLSSVTNVSKCKKVKRLCICACYELTDAGIQGLERIPTLEELDLRGSRVTSVSHLSACRSLKGLMLDGCSKLSDRGIRGLELIPTLEVLDLGWTGITSVSHLAACKALKRLNLSGCKELTDVGILGLELIPTLRGLDLTATNVVDLNKLTSRTSPKILRIERRF